ncbi:hypothetical protein LTR36_003052 [Oleoguttula mirabilis]|uniref:Uncharacterized protein n=1 Tax=Oleoguttula mirabilis TaxID=1507867 RepID=A0AAV9JWF6_9PEZI|nr:hypothetical protein LTR36_003052 [Oleoguttula mirabilis]
MKATKQAHLLGIPRELSITVVHTTAPALLRACRQIHDEYWERVRPRSSLAVTLVTCNVFDERGLKVKLKDGVPAAVLRDAKRVVVGVSWGGLLHAGALGPAMEWMGSSHAAEQLQHLQSLPWTPTKAFCQKLKHFLSAVLQPSISPSATVQLLVMLDALPDPHDPYPVGPINPATTRYSSRSSALMQLLFHPGTIISELAGADDADVGASPSPLDATSPRKLDVRFTISTPLYCTLAANGAELVANRKARLAFAVKDVVRPVCETSKEIVHWRLQPTADEDSFRGYWPTVESVVEYERGLRMGGLM